MTGVAGIRILIVEDQYLVADELTRELTSRGALVVGPAASLHRALELLDAEQIDIAVLDIDLAGQAVYPVARELRARGLPFIFVTGYERDVIQPDFADVPHLEKPFRASGLVMTIQEALRQNPRPLRN